MLAYRIFQRASAGSTMGLCMSVLGISGLLPLLAPITADLHVSAYAGMSADLDFVRSCAQGIVWRLMRTCGSTAAHMHARLSCLRVVQPPSEFMDVLEYH